MSGIPMSPHRSRRVGAALAVALLSSLLPVSSVRADEVADKRGEAGRLALEIETHGRRAATLAEDFNEARLRAGALEGQIAQAEKQVADTDADAQRAQQRLKGQSIEAYVRGGSTRTVEMVVRNLSTPRDLERSVQYVRAASAVQQQTLDELRSSRHRLEAHRASLRARQNEAAVNLRQMEVSRSAAEAAEGQSRAILAKLTGELAVMVEAEAQRRRAADEERAQVELTVRRERAAEAAAAAAARATSTTVPPRLVTSPSTTTRPPATTAPVNRPTPTTQRLPAPAPTPRPTTAPPATTPPAATPGVPSAPGTPARGFTAALAEAQRQLGKPYQWGGAGPDTFDCSGLTAWAWRAGGRTLPHSSRAQWAATTRVAIDDLQPGDLVFYGTPIHHVGLYVGNGLMIEAPETGKNVRYASIHRSGYVGAGRLP